MSVSTAARQFHRWVSIAFTVAGVPYLAVANSLSGALHFRTDSRIYKITAST